MIRLPGRGIDGRPAKRQGRRVAPGRRGPDQGGPGRSDTDGDLVGVLTGIVREARELQTTGRLLDPVSRTEVSLLEHQLRVMEARLVVSELAAACALTERAAAVSGWARALKAASEATRGHSRRLRKDLYRTRTIVAPRPD